MKAFLIQARLGSSRLPNKIIKPFYNKETILDIIIRKLEKFPSVKTIVATSTNPLNDSLIEILEKKNVSYFRGDENDVLQRFISAAEYYNVNEIFRICSDNPFLDVESMQILINETFSSDADYISFKINNTPSIKTHYGFFAEYVTLPALKKIRTLTDSSFYNEHVTNYIYSNPEYFNIQWVKGPEILEGRKDIRLTIDTDADYESAKEIYRNLIIKNEDISISTVVNYLDNHPIYLEKMRNEITKNEK